MKHTKLHFALGLSVLALCTLCWGAPADARAQSTAPNAAVTNTPTLEEPEGSNANPNPAPAPRHRRPTKVPHPHGVNSRELVVFGRDVEVKPGDTTDTVVVFGGSARIHGKVRQDVVVFGGDIDVDGEVGGDTVAFLGSITLRPNAAAKQDAVAFLGDITVQTNATVHGDAVAFAGQVDVADGGSVQGSVVPFAFGPGHLALPRWLRGWFTQCVFKLRPLALQVPLVWIVAGVFFLLYLFIAAVFPQPVRACVDELNRRPASTLLFGLLAKILVPLLLLLLAITGIGVLVVPFILVALFFGAAVGKVALLEWVGAGLGRRFGSPLLQKPLVAFLLGTVMLTLFYLVWVVGLLVFLLFSVWGLGVAVTALFGGMRREASPQTPPPTIPRDPAPMPTEPPPGPAPAAFTTPSPDAPAASQTAMATAQVAAAPAPAEIEMYPRAGFWERMGAGFLDVVLVGILAGLVHGPVSLLPRLMGGPPFGLLVALAYFAGMWTWKGTTIGGIVLGLKVVRLDRRPLTFAVCLVRALMAVFSVVVLFLGFLWIAWDPEKQAWHDRVAGTVVLRLPRGTPLV